MIFCSSPMPKSEKVKGMSAATGILRPNRVIGRKNACTRGKQPQSTPSGTPTSAASPNPSARRRSVVKQIAGQGPVKPQAVKARERFGRAGEPLRRRDDSFFGLASVTNHQSAKQASDAGHAHEHRLPGRASPGAGRTIDPLPPDGRHGQAVRARAGALGRRLVPDLIMPASRSKSAHVSLPFPR